jgi:hypothetical protein
LRGESIYVRRWTRCPMTTMHDRREKLEKIDAEIARMEVEMELEHGGGEGVGLGSKWASLLSSRKIEPGVIVSERKRFRDHVLDPVLSAMGKIGGAAVTDVDGPSFNAIFTVSKPPQPDTCFSLAFSGSSQKTIYVALFVSALGVSFTVAAPSAGGGKTPFPDKKSDPYRLESSKKGAKDDYDLQIAALKILIERALKA